MLPNLKCIFLAINDIVLVQRLHQKYLGRFSLSVLPKVGQKVNSTVSCNTAGLILEHSLYGIINKIDLVLIAALYPMRYFRKLSL